MKLAGIEKPHEIFGDYSIIDQATLEQFRGAMDYEHTVKGALMPDAHLGYSLPIGAAVATRGVIVPAWVGYDIGCGMCAIPTSYSRSDVVAHQAELHEAIHQEIPVGNSKRGMAIRMYELEVKPHTSVVDEAIAIRSAWHQMGTLGGGNHFIEIGYDENNMVWVIIHSGSRGVGHQVAGTYMKKAAEYNGVTQGNLEGHYGLPVESPLAKDYIKDMTWCLEYALLNRRTMLHGVQQAFQDVGLEGEFLWSELINRHHNHAELKDGLWVHRKGATHAESGMKGVIPANMLDGAFITLGRGNQDSLCSSSHGCGRALSRSQAKKTLDVQSFIDDMKACQITSDASESTIDEAPEAYKDYVDVMLHQEGVLLDVITQVFPMISVKG